MTLNPGSTPAPVNAAALRQINDLPGPRGWPLLGNLLQVRMPRIHRDMEAWSRQYGPFFRVRLGPTTLLVPRHINIETNPKTPSFRRKPESRGFAPK